MNNKLRLQIYSKLNSVYTLEFYQSKKWFFPSCLRACPELTEGHPESCPVLDTGSFQDLHLFWEGVEGEKLS
ncbi:MAG: hypothetical protein OEM46_05800 [Ignavibacteria bacterium]|nr:hypothetical protein [Ignavibacteria bacterium]